VKKNRLDWVIEKAVELGATDLHPVLTQNTENRHLNPDRLTAQIIESAEQCERLDLPTLHPMLTFNALEVDGLLACIERLPKSPPLAQALPPAPVPIALLVGPEGGFTAAERDWLLTQPGCTPVHLGPRILRSDTAICAALSIALTFS
jgi:16S rRNA (uracil1498-N3)-methyltransferase